ncbi:cysteine desulfurase family protein [Homoserinibacter sp. GY 40078]|uniref:cysteine desulfurase family protein n=1 Tax=Homoserinibacter sp. GY 40078 TaxID=2603275 RepID=UPI0011CB3FE1|nr:cysteine desulfurase family protein [Homoserinibacter sp. GY 40078]TXK17811.1 cysteine desulfurase [Homoserinibacter sp. GY 40078]
MLYLDTAATTPVRREAIEAMWPYLTGDFGNPSSTHELGRRAAHAVQAARETVAHQVGARASEVVFTSGGTEADNLAVKGIALAEPRGRHVVTSAIEHEAVHESVDHLRRLHGFDVSILPVDADGLIDPVDLAQSLRPETTLVSIQHASNEIGTIQPIRRLADLAHEVGARFHTDAVQSAADLKLGLDELGVDAISIAGHKLGAPKGIGALIVRGGVPLEPVLNGGGQERERRSGTENVPGIVALATAFALAALERPRHNQLVAVRDAIIAGVRERVPDALVTGSRSHRLPGHVSFCFPGTSGEAVLLELEQRGIVCSSGSACAAGRDEPSAVLLALGIPPEVAQTAVRITLPLDATPAWVPEIVERVAAGIGAVRALAS